MTNHRSSRRYRKTSGRRVWVFSELNHDLRPEQIAKIITAAGLEQARLEADAQADDCSEPSDVDRSDLLADSGEQGGDRA